MSFNFFAKNLPPPASQKVRYLRCEGFKVACLGLQLVYCRPREWDEGQPRPHIKGQMLIDNDHWMEFELPVSRPMDVWSWTTAGFDAPQRDATKAYPYRDAKTGEEGIELPAWTMPELTEWILQQEERQSQEKINEMANAYRNYVSQPKPVITYDEATDFDAEAFAKVLKGRKP